MWIVRHGESTWNAKGLVQGQAAGPVLTSRGRRQAREAARLMSGAPVTAVVASDLERAVQTAAPIARALGLPVRTDARLRERCLGAAEGQPLSALGPEWSGIREGLVVDPDAAPPGGESVGELYGRVTACVRELAEDPELLVVTHGGVVRVLVAWTAGRGPEGMRWDPVDNGRLLWRSAPPVAAHMGTAAGAAGPGGEELRRGAREVREVEAQR